MFPPPIPSRSSLPPYSPNFMFSLPLTKKKLYIFKKQETNKPHKNENKKQRGKDHWDKKYVNKGKQDQKSTK